jgi:hypothetical protein
VCFNHDLVWSDIEVIVCELELLLSHLYIVVCWVLNWDCCLRAFPNRADQLKLLNLFALLDCDCELVEDVLTRGLLFEGCRELVDAHLHCEEVQFVLFY